MTLSHLHEANASARYETARRIGQALLKSTSTPPPEVIFGLHDALVALADFSGARDLLERYGACLKGFQFKQALLLAGDFRKLGNPGHYRTSQEARAGFTVDEYLARYAGLSQKYHDEARSLARTEEEAASLRAFEKGSALPPFSRQSDFVVAEPSIVADGGTVSGRILDEQGTPLANVTVTLGLASKVEKADPATFFSHAMHYAPVIAPLSKRTTHTDLEGQFQLEDIPPGRHEFLAITLPLGQHAIATRFLARDIEVMAHTLTDIGDLVAAEWQSAPAITADTRLPDALQHDGHLWRKVSEHPLHNPFHYEFPRQVVELPSPATTGSIRVFSQIDEAIPHQISSGQVIILTSLPAQSRKTIGIYHTPADIPPLMPDSPVSLEHGEDAWQLHSGSASFQIAGDASSLTTPPLLAVRAVDGIWRGAGRFRLPNDLSIVHRHTSILEEGPLRTTVENAYTFSNGRAWALRLTALAGEPLLLVHERSDEIDGASFDFSLREFSGGRGFLHWTPETGSRHWSTLQAVDEVVGRLPESVPWWIPPQGFGYAVTPDGLEEQDYVAVFTRRRGEWIDRAFARITKGPIDEDGSENRELDWPYPEMVGSSISMIDAATTANGDVFFRFGFFDGERQWGLLASSFARNDGPFKELGRLQHAFSSPRLQEFKDWHFDVPDTQARPHVLVHRDELTDLRRKMNSPRFAPLLAKLRREQVVGSQDGLVFALDGDPLAAWYKRTQLLAIADVRSKMTLLGRDFSDTYSPVGGRDITSWAEEYDIIAASGVFTPDEERRMRAFFILMGHMYMEEDFMNWRFNARNANFEADRVDIVGAIGLAFDGHPDAGKFLDHVIDRTRTALLAYCTPGSGKWYENPACYYLHASKCRMNLVYHLAKKGLLELESVPRLKDFLRWALHLLTPPQPVDYQVMLGGDATSYQSTAKIRKIPPIGDHAGIGRWLPEHYAFIGKLFRKTDPEFGQTLINAYFSANADALRLLGELPWENARPEFGPWLRPGETYRTDRQDESGLEAKVTSAVFGNLPLFCVAMEESDIPQTPTLSPRSMRLEGYGAVFRNGVNTPRESYLLIKQGPGGYRYHRTEGSFLLFAHGVPLVYDGGEAGETWRHNTLSFHDVHMPLSAGRVEQYFDAGGFQFLQGVHPVILQPGEPVFLSDSCRHELVEEAYRRFHLDPPAVVRSFAWIDDEYLVIHDDLSASRPAISHWHLHVVGSAPEVLGTSHYRFAGRFGIDLEVVLPGQQFSQSKVEPLPIAYNFARPEDWFTMQHLQVSQPNSTGYLAILRPRTTTDDTPLSAEPLYQHDRIVGTRIGRDLLWFTRSGVDWRHEDIHFSGTFGAILRRERSQRVVLMGAGTLIAADFRIESTGPAVNATLVADTMKIEARGEGCLRIQAGQSNWEITVSQEVSLTIPLKNATDFAGSV